MYSYENFIVDYMIVEIIEIIYSMVTINPPRRKLSRQMLSQTAKLEAIITFIPMFLLTNS